jgi:hypothetical protein
MRKCLGIVGCVVALCAAGANSAAAETPDQTSTFASGDEGWTIAQTYNNPPFTFAPPVHEDGAINFTDSSGGDVGFFASPASWAGDATNHFGGTFSYDLKTDPGWGEVSFAILGNSDLTQSICFAGDSAPVAGGFTTYSFTINPTDALNSGCNLPATVEEINAVLLDLDLIAIDAEEFANPSPGTVTSLDNVSLTGGTPPEPYDVERTVSLNYEKLNNPFLGPYRAFTGEVLAGEFGCSDSVEVTVMKKRKGPDLKLGTRTTGSEGGFQLKYKRKRGTYYATVSPVSVGLANCLAAQSDPFKIG